MKRSFTLALLTFVFVIFSGCDENELKTSDVTGIWRFMNSFSLESGNCENSYESYYDEYDEDDFVYIYVETGGSNLLKISYCCDIDEDDGSIYDCDPSCEKRTPAGVFEFKNNAILWAEEAETVDLSTEILKEVDCDLEIKETSAIELTSKVSGIIYSEISYKTKGNDCNSDEVNNFFYDYFDTANYKDCSEKWSTEIKRFQ